MNSDILEILVINWLLYIWLGEGNWVIIVLEIFFFNEFIVYYWWDSEEIMVYIFYKGLRLLSY